MNSSSVIVSGKIDQYLLKLRDENVTGNGVDSKKVSIKYYLQKEK
jgi:hypothetical protein